MDLACGDKESNVFAGLLLRAIIDSSEKLIEGPCLVVDKILELNGDFAARLCVKDVTLQGTNISQLGKRKIIDSNMPYQGDILISWRVIQ